MTSEQIVMLAKFQVPQGTENIFHQAFIELNAPSRTEDGFLTYELLHIEAN